MAGSVVSPVVRPVTLLTGSPVVATSGLQYNGVLLVFNGTNLTYNEA